MKISVIGSDSAQRVLAPAQSARLARTALCGTHRQEAVRTMRSAEFRRGSSVWDGLFLVCVCVLYEVRSTGGQRGAGDIRVEHTVAGSADTHWSGLTASDIVAKA